MQAVDPSDHCAVPAAHEVQATIPSAVDASAENEYRPVGQLEQANDPANAEKVPEEQTEQIAAPVAAEKKPAAQATQAEAPAAE